MRRPGASLRSWEDIVNERGRTFPLPEKKKLNGSSGSSSSSSSSSRSSSSGSSGSSSGTSSSGNSSGSTLAHGPDSICRKERISDTVASERKIMMNPKKPENWLNAHFF